MLHIAPEFVLAMFPLKLKCTVFATLVLLFGNVGVELEVVEKTQMLEWLANNYKSFGCVLE